MRVRHGVLQLLLIVANVLWFAAVSFCQSQDDILGEDQAQQDRKFSEVRRAWELGRIDSDSSAGAASKRQVRQRFITLMQHDSEFDIGSVPVSRWLSGGQATEIPWSIDVDTPTLRMDQRMEISYKATIAIKQLNKYGALHDLFFIVGVSSWNGDWLVEPKVVHAVIKDKLNDNDELWFSDWIFATPGRYELWFILFDRQIGKHNIAKRRVQVRQLQSDALPHLGERLPQLEFPRVSDREGGSVLGLYGNLNLPVQNKQKASIELIPIVNHFETRPSRKSVRDHSQKIVAIINTLSQMRVADGSISFTAVDVTGRQIPFQRVASDRLNWADLFQVLVNANELETVSKRDVLAESNSADFLWQTINEQLTGCNESVRVLLIVGSALGHEQSKSEFPTLPSDCKSRIFYLRLDGSGNGAELLQNIPAHLHPTTFHIRTALDLRKALATVIRELERL
jgi:hypothetical protein